LSALAFEVGKASSTWEVRELAEQILQMLAEEQSLAEENSRSQANRQTGTLPSAPGSSVPEDIEDTEDAKGTEGDGPDEPDPKNPDTKDPEPAGQSSDDEGSSPSVSGSSDSQEDFRNPAADATSAETQDDESDTLLNENPVANPDMVADRENGNILPRQIPVTTL
jgi:hypothetical protein